MKLYRLQHLVCLFLFLPLLSCDKDNEPVRLVQEPLIEALGNIYWTEEIRFIYMENGERCLSEELQTLLGTMTIPNFSNRDCPGLH